MMEDEDEATKEFMYKMVTNPETIKQVHSIALPTEVLMFKIIRACVGVE